MDVGKMEHLSMGGGSTKWRSYTSCCIVVNTGAFQNGAATLKIVMDVSHQS